MLRRKMYDKLLEWKGRDHKCLVISGQRQVGKTYIVDAFARAEYKHYLYINFHDSPQMNEIFEGDITASEIIKQLALRFGNDSVVDGETLLFLDEIQEGQRAYGALKQLTLYGKIDVIASGSLLGVNIPGTRSAQGDKCLIPMGYEETVQMYPMDFEEYLWARKVPEECIEELKHCISSKTSIEKGLFSRISQLYNEYLIVGGMPEAVNRFVETEDFRPVTAIQNELVNFCIRDINRYNSGIDRIKTSECFESIPNQLADTNKKFMYSRINGEKSRRSADRYMENLLWIKGAGYGDFCYGLEQPALPLDKYAKRDVFKIYLSDTGLLLNMYGDRARMALYSGDHSYNFGAVIENSVANNLTKCGRKLYYYRKDKGEGKMELDFVSEFWDGLAVLEVKSGNDRSARSLEKVNTYHKVSRRIILEDSNIHVDEDGIEHYPVFASAFVGEMDPKPEGPVFS